MASQIIPLCAPAVLYLVLAIISVIILLFNRTPVVTLLMKLLFIIVWTWLLNFLCTSGFTVVSWILVLLPFVLLIVLMIFGTVAISKMTPIQLDQLMKDE